MKLRTSTIQRTADGRLAWPMTNSLSSSTPTNVLVLGGTGRTGSRIASRLAQRGVHTTIASRRATVPFLWEDRSTWDDTLHGSAAAYVCYSPDLAFDGVAGLIAEFAYRARQLGVRRLVLLSGRGEEGARASEEAVQNIAPEWTIVRSSWFAQNFSESFLLGPVLRGRLVVPAGDVTEPFVDLDDLAEIASAALVGEGHVGRIYEVTGPRLLSFHDVAEELSAAAGRLIEYSPSTADDFVDDVAQDGIPPEDAQPLAGLFTTVLDGRNSSITPDLELALGRPATDFAEYARRAASSGVWMAQQAATPQVQK
jgi:uncharacterized protein YbjT (DUF2867 family)